MPKWVLDHETWEKAKETAQKSEDENDGGKATQAIAEYSLALAASQIILLHEVASEAEADVPF